MAAVMLHSLHRTRAPWRNGLERLSTGAAAGLILVCWLVLFAPWLGGWYTIPWDAKAIFYPQFQFLAQCVNSGRSPAWQPYLFAGWTQIGDPQSLIFSAPHLLVSLATGNPSFWLADAVTFVVLLGAGFAVLGIAIERGWQPAAGAVGAIVIMFGASSAWRLEHTGQIVSLGLLAVTLYLTQRVLVRRGIGASVLAGLAAGLMIVQPNHVGLLGCYVLAGFVVLEIASAPAPLSLLRSLVVPALAGLTVLAAVAAIPMLLIVETLAMSNRPAVSLAQAATGSLPPSALIGALFPNLFATLVPNAYWGPGGGDFKLDTQLSPSMTQVYVGALPIVLALLIGLRRRGVVFGDARSFAILLAGLLLYALGTWTPLFQFAFSVLPGIDASRRPADATFVAGLMAAILTARLVDDWLSGAEIADSGQLRRWLIALAIVGGTAASGIALAIAHDRVGLALIGLVQGGVIMALALAGLIAARRLQSSGRGAVSGLVLAGLLAADLALHNGPNVANAYLPTAYDVLRQETTDPLVTELKRRTAAIGPMGPRRVEIFGLDGFWLNLPEIHRLEGTLAYNPLRTIDYERAYSTKEELFQAHSPHFTPAFPSYQSMLARLLGLRFVVTDRPIEQIDPRLAPGQAIPLGEFTVETSSGRARLYELPDGVPRALLVTHTQRANFADIVATGAWPDGFDPLRTVLLDASLPPQPPTPAARANAKLSPDLRPTLKIKRDRHPEVVIDVTTPEPAVLVVHDIYHPWWRAEINGRPAAILKANLLFRAVRVPAGRSRVRMIFRPVQGAWATFRARRKRPVRRAGLAPEAAAR